MENELTHYGVKGMRWGVRRARTQTTSNSKGKTKKSDDKSSAKKRARKEKIAKAVAKGAELSAKVATASLVDDMFYGGAGKKIAKEAAIQTGRAAVTAYTMARGGYDIRWYDK